MAWDSVVDVDEGSDMQVMQQDGVTLEWEGTVQLQVSVDAIGTPDHSEKPSGDSALRRRI
ncbi:MAG: hypothetical protein VX694_03655 [Planctomycetota bacterium]|nr:hypothetical protein [Planctomycetota bacterium]